MVKSATTAFTTCEMPADVLPVKLESLLYCAVMVWLPAVRADVDNFACPLLRLALPRLVVLSA